MSVIGAVVVPCLEAGLARHPRRVAYAPRADVLWGPALIRVVSDFAGLKLYLPVLEFQNPDHSALSCDCVPLES
jgi:hypothetical protein